MLVVLKYCQSSKEIKELKIISVAGFHCYLCVSEHIRDANCYSDLGNAYLCGRAALAQG